MTSLQIQKALLRAAGGGSRRDLDDAVAARVSPGVARGHRSQRTAGAERTRHQSRYEEDAPHDTLPSNATLLPMRRRGGTNEQTKSSIALIFQAVEILTEYPSRASAISAYRVSVP